MMPQPKRVAVEPDERRPSMPPATFQALVDAWADVLVSAYERREAAGLLTGAYHPEPKEPTR